jgi:hypothetical protein
MRIPIPGLESEYIYLCANFEPPALIFLITGFWLPLCKIDAIEIGFYDGLVSITALSKIMRKKFRLFGHVSMAPEQKSDLASSAPAHF